MCVFLIHLHALAFDPFLFAYFVQVSCCNDTIEIAYKFSIQTFFFLIRVNQNTNIASLSTSHVPPLAFSIVFEPSNLSVHEFLAKKPKRSYDKFQIFQDSWATKFLWAKLVLGDDSQQLLVKCMTCLYVEIKDKFLSPKLDILQKHVG